VRYVNNARQERHLREITDMTHSSRFANGVSRRGVLAGLGAATALGAMPRAARAQDITLR
jgi:hypothetical protein